ncbi:hypothetical protein [Vibrio coralliirubri]|uniref:hypothetical protein n=1 Tax=Vibrio coralliirubri TaxID=1516159 RepID=UPI0012E06475|nr:hypothetical protein [Vibrio coralliirubri]
MMRILLRNLALWTGMVLVFCALFASLDLINNNFFGVIVPPLLMFICGAVLCVLSVNLSKSNDSGFDVLGPCSNVEKDRLQGEVYSITHKAGLIGFSVYGAALLSLAVIQGNIVVGVLGIVASFSLFSNHFRVVFTNSKHFRKHYGWVYLCFLCAPIVDELTGDTSFGFISALFSPLAMIHISFEWSEAYKKLKKTKT